MGKLNYTNRKSEGLKLGEIVAKDLRKRAVTHPTKASEPSPLEINLHGRSLTDKGLEEIAIALQEVLPLRPSGLPRYELEDLNLSDNGLTVESLPHLARVVRLAARSLRELDLSGNTIEINHTADSEAWEVFLDSFKQCELLSRLDLSGNELMGVRPFEVLARTFVKNARLDAVRATANEASSLSQTNVLGNRENFHTKEIEDLRIDERLDVQPFSKDNVERVDKAPVLKAYGLRSTRSVVFSNCGMSYAGALFFSSAFFQYRPFEHPKRHRRRSSSTTAATQSDHNVVDQKGLVYLPNETLSSAAISLLESAAIVAKSQSEVELEHKTENAGQDENASKAELDAEQMHANFQGSGRRLRSSTFSGLGHSEDLPEFKASAKIRLESYRKKAERSTIEDLGTSSIQLWSTALKMLCCIRSLCKFDNNQKFERSKGAGVSSPLSGATLVDPGYDDDAVQQSLSTSRPPPQAMTLINGKTLTSSPVQQTVYTGAGAAFTIDFPKLQTSKQAVRSQSLLLPPVHSTSSRNTNRNESNGNATTTAATFADVANRASATADLTLLNQYQHHHHASKQDGLYPWHIHLPSLTRRQSQDRGRTPLPQHVWRRIVALAVGGPPDALSEAQMNKVFAWAVDRSTLGIELDRLGKSESAQIWMVLDVMGCLAYEV